MKGTSALSHPAWIGLDIGGANIKVAHEGGDARTVPFEVWKRPTSLARRSRRWWRRYPRATRPP